MVNKRLINTGVEVAPAAFDPLQNFETVTYTGNGGTQKITGYIRKGAAFNGSSSKIDLSDGVTGGGAFSLSVWINSADITTAKSIFQFGLATNNTIESFIQNGIVYFRSFNDTTSVTYFTAATTAGDISLNTWHNIVYVFPNTTDTNGCKIYIDGLEEGAATSSTGSISLDTTNQRLGARTNNSLYYNGKLDQVRIFNKALSSSEVTTLYGETYASSTVSTTDIFGDGSGVALYELDENATDTGGINGNFGGAGVFNGTNSYITGSPNIGFGQSISMWFDVDSSISATQAKLWSQSIGGGTTWAGAGLYWDGSNFSFSMQVRNGAYRYQTAGTVTINSGWNHLVFTFDSNAGYSAWLNNSELTMTDSLVSGTVSSFPAPSGTTTIGRQWGNGDDYYFKGKIDDVRIYPDKLTSDEVGYIYNNTTASIPTDYVAYYKLDGDATDETGTYNGTATNVSFGYNGTATNVNYLGMAFQPDLVWIKHRGDTGTYHQIYDSVRGAAKVIFSNDTLQEFDRTNGLTSFDSNGFSLGDHPHSNDGTAPNDLVAWCWKAGGTAVSNTDGSITSTVSANQDAGFSIVKYTGAGTTATVGHGLSANPELIFIKNTSSGTNNWAVAGSILGSTQTLYLNLTNAVESYSDPTIVNTQTSSTFTIGQDSNRNGSGSNHIAYCFHSVDGYQKVGTYTGTGAPNNIVTTGFRPRWVMIKSTAANNGDWNIFDTVRENEPLGDTLKANTSGSEATEAAFIIDITNTGFELDGASGAGGTGQVNKSGITYIYLAIA